MVLAIPRQARFLEGQIPLTKLRERAREEANRSRDYRGIQLRDTYVSETGNWYFDDHCAPLTRHALTQLCARLPLPNGGTVPASYLARCPVRLLNENLNYWLAQLPATNNQVLIRTQADMAGRRYVRAVLSNRYAPVAHTGLLETLEALAPQHGLVVQNWSLDDEQLTLRLTMQGEHPASVDDPLRVGLHISNSEIGMGKVTVSALITRLVCSNGLVIKVADLGGIRRRHVGRANENLDELVRTGIAHVLEQGDIACRRFVQLRELPAPQPLDEFLTRTATQAELPESVLTSAKGYLTGETIYDVVNAFTRAAQDYPINERVGIETAMSRFLTRDPSLN